MMEKRLSEEQGRALVMLARATLRHRLLGADEPQPPQDPALGKEAATFVTLKKAGQLRGCIGNLQPVGAIWRGVRDNALNAAFNDPRFTPLRADEVERVELHVSVLSASRPLPYGSAEELLALLRPGVDGVILRQGGRSATFLPQVWEQLPDPRQFLDHLCRKAGLADGCWGTGRAEIFVYEVQGFAEERG